MLAHLHSYGTAKDGCCIVLCVSASPRVFIAADSFLPIASGIGRVARLTGKLLGEVAAQQNLQVQALALSDARPAVDLGITVQACAGSRARFVLECQRAALTSTHFVYDFAGMARAHPWWFRPRRPALVWIHGIEVWEDTRRDRIKTLARADMLVSNSSYTRERAQRAHGGFDRARVCWLATESTEALPASPSEPGRANVLLLGRIDPAGGMKGYRELIECWPTVVKALPQARLIIAGGGDADQTVRRWVERSPVRGSIDMLGFVPESEIEGLWARADVFAMPSRGEGFGLAYIEAMRHGLPIIGSIHDAASEINPHGVTGYNVDLHHSGDLEQRLIELLEDHALAHRFGVAGRERWEAHFRFGAFRERMKPILCEFLGLEHAVMQAPCASADTVAAPATAGGVSVGRAGAHD